MMPLDDGADFVKNKLTRSYQKLSDNSEKIYEQKYDKVMSIFDYDIEKIFVI